LKSEAADFQKNVLDKFASFKFPDLQPVHSCPSKRREHVEALGLVSCALSDAPCCMSLHEKRLALLANLKRWREVAGHCERMASVAVQFDGVFTGDLAAKHPYPNVPPAKELNAKFFGDPQNEYFFRVSDLKGAELKLGTKAASEAILRIPKRFVETYLRALRLEERYVHADAAISVLQKYIESKAQTPEYDVLCAEFQWLGRESSKVARTKRSRERGDELFRSGNFQMAIEQYGLCLRIDSEGILDKFDPSKSAGGRLHAVL
jgi:hypothetical protein